MRRLGATCVSCVLAIASFVAIGGAGYMTMSGKSLCSMMSCGEKAKTTETANVTTVANKESGEAKSCCPLSKAKAQQVAAKEGGCSEAKTETVAAKEASGCCKAKAQQVAAKAGCTKTCSGKNSYVVLGSSYPVVMPAMFFKADAKVCSASLTESGGCGGAKAQTVAAKEACDPGCCKGSGVRADGQPCKHESGACKGKGEKVAEEKTGEPVASR